MALMSELTTEAAVEFEPRAARAMADEGRISLVDIRAPGARAVEGIRRLLRYALFLFPIGEPLACSRC